MHGMQALTRTHLAVAAAALVAVGGAATILGAYYFQYVLGLRPCPLCLEQRMAYYVSIPLAIVVAVAASRNAPRGVVSAGVGVLGLAMLVNLGFWWFPAGGVCGGW